jgi:hypothetical protein
MEDTMRAMTDADVAAIRSAFDSVLAALPEDRLRRLILELMFAPFTMTRQHRRKPGRPRKAGEGNVVRLPRNGRRRRKAAVDQAKLAERRARATANRRAQRHAAKAGNGNGQDAAITPQAFWRHAEQIEPTRPWLAVVREFEVKEAVAQNCYRSQRLPPSIGPMAVEKFLAVQA